LGAIVQNVGADYLISRENKYAILDTYPDEQYMWIHKHTKTLNTQEILSSSSLLQLSIHNLPYYLIQTAAELYKF